MLTPSPSCSVFFYFSSKVYVLLSLSLSLSLFTFFFTLLSAETTIQLVLFMLLTITRSGRLAKNIWSVYISKSLRNSCVSFFKTDSGLYILLFTLLEFFTSVLAEGFSLEFDGSKSPQVSRTLLSIHAVLSNVVIWIVCTRPPTFECSRPFNNPLVIVPKAPITIGTNVTFMFHSFFNSLARWRYFSFFSHSFSFIPW